jgi:hypothetical protein
MTKLPSTVEDFVRKNIPSVWQLELLLYIKASEKPLWAAEIANAMYLTQETVSAALGHFEKRGLVEPTSREPAAYIFSPRTTELREAVELTGKAYGERKVAVINLIFSS